MPRWAEYSGSVCRLPDSPSWQTADRGRITTKWGASGPARIGYLANCTIGRSRLYLDQVLAVRYFNTLTGDGPGLVTPTNCGVTDGGGNTYVMPRHADWKPGKHHE